MASKPYELDVVVVGDVPLDNSAWRAGWEIVKQKGNKVWVTSPMDRTVNVEINAGDIASIILHNAAAFAKQDLKLVVVERESGNQLKLVGQNFAQNPPKYDYISKYADLELEQPYILGTAEVVVITEKTRDIDRVILSGKKLVVNQFEPWSLVLDNESCLHISKIRKLPRKHYAHMVLSRLLNPNNAVQAPALGYIAFNTTRTDGLFLKLSASVSSRVAVSFQNILNCRVPSSIHSRDWLKPLKLKLLKVVQRDSSGHPAALSANSVWTFSHTPDAMIGEAIHRYPDRTGGTFEIYQSEGFEAVPNGKRFKIHYQDATERVNALRTLSARFESEVVEEYYVSGTQVAAKLYDTSIEKDIYPVLLVQSREGPKYLHLELF